MLPLTIFFGGLLVVASVCWVVDALRSVPRGCNGCGQVGGLDHANWCKTCQRQRREMSDW